MRGTSFGGPATDLFSESIRIEVLMICCRSVIDLGSLLSYSVKVIDGLAVVLGTLLNRILQTLFPTCTADGQGSD